MHQSSKVALHQAIAGVLAKIPNPRTEAEAELVWHRLGPNNWKGEHRLRLRLALDWDEGIDWDAESMALHATLAEHHADHLGMVGTWTTGLFRLTAADMLRLAVNRLWYRHRDFSVATTEIGGLVDEISAFIDSDSVRLEYLVPLINLRSGVSSPIVFGEHSLILQQLTESQINHLYGGSVGLTGYNPLTMYDWAFVGELSEQKLLGTDIIAQPEEPAAFNDLRRRLDTAVLALRTFKDGAIGYQQISTAPMSFVPLSMGISTRTFGHEYVPMGLYQLGEEEVPALASHAKQFKDIDKSLEVACVRLGLASTRLNARDRMIDAVIGLEAILLDSTGDDAKYKGELRFRFSLNYAALQSGSAERLAAFKLARDVYDRRSELVHGSPLDKLVRLGDERVSLDVAAARAVDILRALVKSFLPSGNQPEYKGSDYWLKRALG